MRSAPRCHSSTRSRSVSKPGSSKYAAIPSVLCERPSGAVETEVGSAGGLLGPPGTGTVTLGSGEDGGSDHGLMADDPMSAATHISWVLLTGDRALKIYKPVRTDVLDHRDLARRREACEREVELNRRLAPDVYEGVATIVLEDQVLEPVVAMRRMPASRRLAGLLGAHEGTRRGPGRGGLSRVAAVARTRDRGKRRVRRGAPGTVGRLRWHHDRVAGPELDHGDRVPLVFPDEIH